MTNASDKRVGLIRTGDRIVDNAVNKLARAVALPDPATTKAARRQLFDKALLWVPGTASTIASTEGSAAYRRAMTPSAASSQIFNVADSIMGSGSQTCLPALGTRKWNTLASTEMASKPVKGIKFSCWIQARAYFANGSAIFGKKYAVGAGWPAQPTTFHFALTATGLPTFTLKTVGGYSTITGDEIMRRGIIHYLEGTYDGTTIRFNVDGTETGTNVADGSGIQWSDGPFFQFQFPDAAAPDAPFGGYLEDSLIEGMTTSDETTGRTRYLRGLYGVGAG